MRIVAFDLGINFAWASNTGTKRRPYVWGAFVLKGPRAHRQGDLMSRLNLFFANNSFDVVVYETPFARGRDATRSLWGYAGVIEACATLAKLPVVDVSVPTIKTFAAKHGKAPKISMIAAAQAWGYVGENEHVADAFCLLKYAEANLEKVEK